ncbi:MAG: FAD-dependent oxidoreductase [Sphingomonas taxi]|uniref:FAD-dependent oxidoreductase n=1 Tax=Sphingomonas taxi TaxID=1549858 RepID=A0A2W5NXE4_9SPHN|nr:MAG: FAD-dependent oxidoreductase [Sphingomonas taxi]
MFETDADDGARHRIVIVGGGVAGLDLAVSLGRHPALSVTVIDLATAHVWKPMLHSIAAGTRASADVALPYAAQAQRHGFTYIAGRARAVDRATRRVHVDSFALHGRELLPERDIGYDTLVLAIGSVAAPFGVDGVEDHARHIDTLEEAQAFQADLLPRLVEAAHAGRRLAVAIVGGGATGVQLAAELVQMADIADSYGLDGSRSTIDVTLVDRGSRLLPAFPETISTAVRERLERLGVRVRTDIDVTAATPGGLHVAGADVAADLTVWAAGVQAAPLAVDLPRDRSDRILVDCACRAVEDPHIYAIGDCASLTSPGNDRPLPPTAQVAYQQAVHLASALPRHVAGRSIAPFRFREFGALVRLGTYDGYAELGKFGFLSGVVRGRLARFGHALLYRRHQTRLHGLRPMLRLWMSDILVGDLRPAAVISET